MNDYIDEIFFLEYIPPYFGYKPKKLKWYQKIWYSIYNAREGIMMTLLLLLWIACIIFMYIKGYGKYIPVSVICGLMIGLTTRY